MGGAGDGKNFREALHERENNGLVKWHADYVPEFDVVPAWSWPLGQARQKAKGKEQNAKVKSG
jgi:hypothetical protein